MKKMLRNAGAVLGVGGVGIYTVYKMVFGRVKKDEGIEAQMLKGKQYEPYAELIRDGIEKVGRLQFQRIFIESRDGVTLAGKYYQVKEGAPLVLFFHGYHGDAVREGSGILRYARKRGCNVLLVDQRGHGKSGGKTICFGIKERYDCLDWIRYANRRFGDKTPILLTGISMGASTVLMAAGLGLPANVRGIIADSTYSEPKEILKTVMKQLRFPVNVTYTAVKLGANLFGGFDIEEASALEAMKGCRLPVLFIHGDEDYFVPCEMSRVCFEMCIAPEKRFVLVKGAAHGLGYCVDGELYEKELDEFFEKTIL